MGIKDFNNCFEDAIRKMYRLTEEEWEEFKEILENGFNKDKNPIYKLNICELDLLINFPECAIEVYKAIEKATIMTIYKWGQSSVKDCSDAFRHAYWMALISRVTVCGGAVARAFGVAHECDLPAGANDKNMDLFNNDLGISIAENNPGLSEAELANLLCNYINSGDFKIMADPYLPSEHLIFSTGCICK